MNTKTLFLSSIGLCLAALMACTHTSEPPKVLTEDPILTLGHGVFFGPDRKLLTPNTKFIESAQNYYIATLSVTEKSSQSDKTRKLIDSLVDEKILANALFLDWLIETVKPDNLSHLTSVNNALRWYYVLNIQRNSFLPKDKQWSKGIAPEIAKLLEHGGVTVFQKTKAGGEAYVEECRNAGVPVPEAMFSNEWRFQGIFENEFISTGSQAELWLHTSDSPEGVCLALPRYPNSSPDDAGLLGIICLGIQTSKSCFFDNPRGKTFRRDVEVSVDDFVGGIDLVANAQGECSDCHSGENPFVVHPEKPAFAGLPPHMPLAWPDPLVDASWPQNPGPTNLLDAVASTGKCDGCHRAGSSGGRFPEVSNQLPGYCNTVIGTAIGSLPKRTMPPFGADIGQYTTHIQALQNACNNPPTVGTVVDFDQPDDSNVVSPPIVIDPLYQCATKVAVRGAILNAKLSLFINGTLIESVIARDPDHEEFNVPALVANDIVTAQQEFNGVLSGLSAAITVRDHKVDFPDGLPTPEIDPSLIYECAEVISVRHVPGAKVTIFSNGGDPISGSTSTDWTIFSAAKRPFVVGDSFTAKASLCEDGSGNSAAKSAVTEPSSIPAPTFDPADTYDGQELVNVGTLVYGSRTRVAEANFGAIGDFTTPISWKANYDIATLMGSPLGAGDQLLAQQSLCSKGPETETPPAQDCSALPAPRISHPVVGDNFVVVTESVPGARIRVYDGDNNELGDGSGTVIILTRAITGTDTLTVVQQIGRCTSSTGYRVSVRNASGKKG